MLHVVYHKFNSAQKGTLHRREIVVLWLERITQQPATRRKTTQKKMFKKKERKKKIKIYYYYYCSEFSFVKAREKERARERPPPERLLSSYDDVYMKII
jgi:hypothetical protein